MEHRSLHGGADDIELLDDYLYEWSALCPEAIKPMSVLWADALRAELGFHWYRQNLEGTSSVLMGALEFGVFLIDPIQRVRGEALKGNPSFCKLTQLVLLEAGLYYPAIRESANYWRLISEYAPPA